MHSEEQNSKRLALFNCEKDETGLLHKSYSISGVYTFTDWASALKNKIAGTTERDQNVFIGL